MGAFGGARIYPPIEGMVACLLSGVHLFLSFSTTGKKQTINDILSNKKLRDQNAYVEVLSLDVLEMLQRVPGFVRVIRCMGRGRALQAAHNSLGQKPRPRQSTGGDVCEVPESLNPSSYQSLMLFHTVFLPNAPP